MVDLEINIMQEDELDEVVEIERESFSLPWSRWMFERELENRDRSHFLVAKNGERVVGYIGFWMVADEAHIVTIAVRRNSRRYGIGTVLIASALILARNLGAEKATLEVRVTNNPAQQLYEKFGFEIISIRKGFYTDTGEDAYVMWIYDLEDKIGKIRALGYKAYSRLKSSLSGKPGE